jgi:hypothetical protein
VKAAALVKPASVKAAAQAKTARPKNGGKTVADKKPAITALPMPVDSEQPALSPLKRNSSGKFPVFHIPPSASAIPVDREQKNHRRPLIKIPK